MLAAEREGRLGAARIAIVIVNRDDAGAIARAEAAGVPVRVMPHKGFLDRAAYDGALVDALRAAHVEVIVLAGYMRLVTHVLLSAFPNRVLNIHPSLLPAFPGLHAQRQALTHGCKVAGCTVHLVDEALDAGPIIAQAAVPVLPTDDEASLTARILVEEHRIYAEAVRLVAERRIVLDGRRASVLPEGLLRAT